MPRLHDRWTVLPHGRLKAVGGGILSVVGLIPMPLGNFPRRMTVVRLSRGRSAVFSAISLHDEEMAEVEALGRPAFLVVPDAHHRLDARAWKQRYPEIKVIAPEGARQKVEEAVPVDSSEDVLDDPEVSFVALDGTSERDSALLVQRPSGTTLIVNDIIAYVSKPPGIGAYLMARLMGFGVKRPQVPRLVRRILVDNPPALARQFRLWAAEPRLERIIVSHGEVIDEGPSGVLAGLADALDGR